jgi:hypothetical protein
MISLKNANEDQGKLQRQANALNNDFNLSALAEDVSAGYKYVVFGTPPGDALINLIEAAEQLDDFKRGMVQPAMPGRFDGGIEYCSFKSRDLAEKFFADAAGAKGKVTPVLEVEFIGSRPGSHCPASPA